MKKMEHWGIAVNALAQVAATFAVYLIAGMFYHHAGGGRGAMVSDAVRTGTWSLGLLIVPPLWIAVALEAKKRESEWYETCVFIVGILYTIGMGLWALDILFSTVNPGLGMGGLD